MFLVYSCRYLVPLLFHSQSTLSPLSFGPRSDLVRMYSEEAPNEVRTRSEQGDEGEWKESRQYLVDIRHKT
ncbi:Uncharacterised protein [Sphingobacterium daejeonense]|nr:Uncharacterised protein [Sphingobacterium daejeonense]